MEAVCSGPSGCSYTSSSCIITPLSTNCENPLKPLSQALCGSGSKPTTCSDTDGMFNYMNAWGGGACGAVGTKWCADGKEYISGGTVYTAYCAVASTTNTTTGKNSTTYLIILN